MRNISLGIRKTSLGTKAIAAGVALVGGYVAWHVFTSILLPVAVLGAIGAGGYYVYKKVSN